MAMNREKIYRELDWLNWKNYILIYIVCTVTSILIVLYSGVFLPVGWLGFILGAVGYIIVLLIQKRMARKLADKIMKMHREDYTVHVNVTAPFKK